VRIEAGDTEYPACDVYLYGRLMRGVLLADDEEQLLRIAVYDAQGLTIRAAGGQPLCVEVRGPVEIRPARARPHTAKAAWVLHPWILIALTPLRMAIRSTPK
jgi:hypothetical protein